MTLLHTFIPNPSSVFGYETIVKLTAAALLSLVAVHWIYMKVLHIAMDKNIVDHPDARKLQLTPTPVLGGLAVYFGLMVGIALAACLFDNFYGLLPIMIGSSVMLYIGSIDDILGLKPSMRAFVEALTILGIIFASDMCVDDLHGLWGIYEFSWWIGIPLTVFAGVGIINAFNMVDGVNGLSSGLCITCSLLMGTIFYKSGDPANAALAYCFAAALLPFLLHNVFGDKSRMFIGDGGTMVMGLLVSWFVMRVMHYGGIATMNELRAPNMNMTAMLLAVVSVPVIDTLRVIVGRLARHQSPFLPDKTHLHHVFVGLGISHSITALSEILLNITVVAIWYLTYKIGVCINGQLYITIIVAVLLVAGTYIFLHYQETHHTKLQKKLQKASIKTHFGRKDWWKHLSRILDNDCKC